MVAATVVCGPVRKTGAPAPATSMRTSCARVGAAAPLWARRRRTTF
jgi:hypothetical protein